MAKPKVAKVFKVVKKTVDSQDQLVVRYKNVDKKQVRALRKLVNDCCQTWVAGLAKIVTEE